MSSKEELLSKIQLYVIADKKICGGKDIEELVRRAIDGGAQMIQYRDKESDDAAFLSIASKLKAVCRERSVPFIVNDRTEIARQLDADGVHVGQKDLSVDEARRILGSEAIIGKSASNVDQAKRAEEEGADYVGIGPIFETLSKEIDRPIGVDIIWELKASLRIPFFPIGGINMGNVDQVTDAGATGIAVISAVVLSEDVKSAAAKLLERLEAGT